MAAMYFVSYALIASMGGLIVGWAQYKRKKAEGTKMNRMVLNAIAGIAVAMWAGAGITVLVDSETGATDTWVMVASVIGAVGIAVFAWQMIQVGRQMDEDRRMLRDLSTRDALTNSWNRRIFQENLQSEMDRAKKTGQKLTLVMFDIDDFHQVNERYGYKIGDGVLRELVHRIFVFMNGAYSVYRFGGEEIALILTGIGADKAEAIADDMTKSITGQTYDVGDQGPISIVVSIGVAPYDGQIDDEEVLIDRTIEGLKLSKAVQGDHVSVAGKDY